MTSIGLRTSVATRFFTQTDISSCDFGIMNWIKIWTR